MTRRALCVGGTPELHGGLEAAYAAADVKLRIIPNPLVGKELEAFRAAEQDADIFVWAAFEPSEARFETLTRATANEYLERTIYSAFQMLQVCLIGMERRRYGRVLALSNINSHRGDEDILASMSSGGIEGLIRSIARETPRKNVTVNALVIGRIEGWDAADSRIARSFYDVYFPFRQPFTASDLATTIVELTTSKSGKINGQVIGFEAGAML
jgi:NAD(P)-dependent dehydrogenase (short-subunit alcohol dehydrogenase family)